MWPEECDKELKVSTWPDLIEHPGARKWPRNVGVLSVGSFVAWGQSRDPKQNIWDDQCYSHHLSFLILLLTWHTAHLRNIKYTFMVLTHQADSWRAPVVLVHAACLAPLEPTTLVGGFFPNRARRISVVSMISPIFSLFYSSASSSVPFTTF